MEKTSAKRQHESWRDETEEQRHKVKVCEESVCGPWECLKWCRGYQSKMCLMLWDSFLHQRSDPKISITLASCYGYTALSNLHLNTCWMQFSNWPVDGCKGPKAEEELRLETRENMNSVSSVEVEQASENRPQTRPRRRLSFHFAIFTPLWDEARSDSHHTSNCLL